MLEKLKLLNFNKSLREIVSKDFSVVLNKIGFTEGQIKIITEKFLFLTTNSHTTEIFEESFHEFIFKQKIGEFSFEDAFKKLELVRANRIYSEISGLFNLSDKVLDYGCGNGLVGQLLSDNDKLFITGCDVVIYPNESVNFPILKLEGYNLDVVTNSFEGGYANSVIHHDENVEKVVQEISRVVSHKFVLIEDTLQGNSEIEKNNHSERLFINDYIYNRLLNKSNIPVPGKYKTAEEWSNLFSRYGWRLTKNDKLGWSSILPAVFRERLIFSR